MPPFLLISASAYLAPSTSLCASAESTPVNGLTMPILTGSSPKARMMNGAPTTWLAPSVRPPWMSVRRRSDGLSDDITILPDHESRDFYYRFYGRGSVSPEA